MPAPAKPNPPTAHTGPAAPATPGRSSQLRLGHVEVQHQLPQLAAVSIVLRKMRGPLFVVIAAMSVGVLGLSLMPPPEGETALTAFQSFYFMTFVAATIGLGEVPYAFSTAQRAWVTFWIYLGVITWAYALSRVITLSQDTAFLAARRAATFRRSVSRLREPFTLSVGYGYIGRSVVKALDSRGRRVVVVDRLAEPIERIGTDLLISDVPGYTAEARDPTVFGMAGLDHPQCEAVLALTGDEQTNLQIVMACRLLRPDLPVLARATSHRVESAMREFNPTAVINANDDYGRFLVLSLHRPHTYRLLTWLMSDLGTELRPLPPPLSPQRWLIAADGPFGDEVGRHLRAAGHAVDLVEPKAATTVSLSGFDALICGARSDSANLALAAHARRSHPELYLAVRVRSHHRLPLLDAFQPDSVFFPPGLIAQRVLAHLVNPHYWKFVSAVMAAPDAWSREVTQGLAALLTTKSPDIQPLLLTERQTPAVARWLEHRPLLLGDLFRSPDDRADHIAAVALLLVRGRRRVILPDERTPLAAGDELLLAGQAPAFRAQTEAIYDDSTLHYVATGHDIPTSWVARRLTRRRRQETENAGPDLTALRSWPPLPGGPQAGPRTRQTTVP